MTRPIFAPYTSPPAIRTGQAEAANAAYFESYATIFPASYNSVVAWNNEMLAKIGVKERMTAYTADPLDLRGDQSIVESDYLVRVVSSIATQMQSAVDSIMKLPGSPPTGPIITLYDEELPLSKTISGFFDKATYFFDYISKLYVSIDAYAYWVQTCGLFPIDIFMQLNPALESHAALDTPFNSGTGDFRVTVCFTAIEDSSNVHYVFSGGLDLIVSSVDGLFLEISASPTVKLCSGWFFDGKYHTVSITRVGGGVSTVIDGVPGAQFTPTTLVGCRVSHIGMNVNSSYYYAGIIANAGFEDLSVPGNSQTYKLGVISGNTETSQEGNHTITLNGIPESNRELFEFDGVKTWNNTSPLPQKLPATIEVA